MANDPKPRLTSDQCRKQADVCREMARGAISAAHRTMLEHMAETWIRIAQDVQSDREATVFRRGVPVPIGAASN